MRCKDTGRVTPASALIRSLFRGVKLIFLFAIVIVLTVPAEVLAYTQDMFELVVLGDPGLIVQNQSYSTRTRQTLFHTATAAGSDTEAFALDGSPQTGLRLAQTNAGLTAGTETGFFTSTATSDIVPPLHIGNGFLGTWIGDPIASGVPIFAGLMFPGMTRMDPGLMPSQSISLAPAGTAPAAKGDAGGSQTKKNTMQFQPVINNALNDSLANQSAKNATTAAIAAANATKQNATAKNESKPSPTPSPTPSPAIKEDQVFYHQQNKPFSTALTYPTGVFKATPEKIRNTSSFDRFLMNTVARSSMDKGFTGTTSSPVMITPFRSLAKYLPYEFIQGARGMTMPGTHLNYRAWPL
ncbi:MAG: hypothetical protein A4E28_02119 [Methanocella sp. PtaU1.Bin125]|nr:MAG: hypothetical protein A4E28_02119 [Methanocella sp. PtaU1.Bin125]